MAASFVAASSNHTETGGIGLFGLTVPKPTGVIDGDLVIVQMVNTEGIDGGSTFYSNTGSNVDWTSLVDGPGISPGYYTQYWFHTVGYGDAFYFIGWHIASSDPTDYTFTTTPGAFGYGYMGYAIQAVAYRDAAVDAFDSSSIDATSITGPQSTPAVGEYAAKEFNWLVGGSSLALIGVDLVGAGATISGRVSSASGTRPRPETSPTRQAARGAILSGRTVPPTVRCSPSMAKRLRLKEACSCRRVS